MKYPILIVLLLCSFCSAQNLVASWDGEAGAGTVDHPNGSLACNATQCVQATSQNVTVYNKSTHAILTQTSTTTFINNAGVTAGTIRNPRVYYDNFLGRFLYVCSCANSYIIVSDVDDGSGTWKGGQLGSDSGDLTMRLGYDKNGVHVCEFMTGSSPFKYRCFHLVNSEVTWTGGASPSLTHQNQHDTQNYELMPAIDRNSSKAAGDPAYFVARDGNTGGTGTGQSFNLLVSYCTWSGTTFCDPQTNNTTIAQGFKISTPIDETQSGSAVPLKGSESHRFFSATQFGTHLWSALGMGPCVTTPACNTPGVDVHDIGLIYDVSVPALTLTDSFKLSHATIGFLFPSLDTDATGNLYMAASGVSSTTNPSVYTWTHKTTDSAGVVNGPTLQYAGTQPYTCVANPVGLSGNYTTVYQDGSSTANVWAMVPYSNSATACIWGTRIMELGIASFSGGSTFTGGTLTGGTIQ